MKVMKLIISLVFLSTCYYCDDGIRFEVIQKENKIYKTTIKVFSKNTVDYEAPDEIIEQIKSSGLTLPMKIDQNQIVIMKVETDTKDDMGFIPFSGKLDSISTEQYINGVLNTNVPAQLDTSFTMSGKYNKNETIIESISSNDIKPEYAEILKKSIGKLMKSIKFPDYHLKVGDTFYQTIPLSIPTQANFTVEMIMTTHYKLMKINPSNAYFDITQEVELSSGMDETKVTLTGSGNGNMEFDHKENQIKSMLTKYHMTMGINTGNFTVVTNSSSETVMTIEVADRIN